MSALNFDICGVAEQLTPSIRASDSKSPNDVYVGTVVLPQSRQRSTAYVKVFPPQVRGQRVYNEVIAHELALQCSLPSPFTFPCACHVSLLRKSTRERMLPDSASPYVLGVASLESAHKAIRQTGNSSAVFWADLMNWPHVANVAVFDELVGNDDRHISNLIRCGRHDYSLIDNERILFGEDWFHCDLEHLVSRRCDSNIIADSIAEGTDEMMRHRMLSQAQRYVMQLVLSAPDSCGGIENVCKAPAGITGRLIEMLNRRRLLLQVLMQWHMEKGDLFQASTK